MARLERLNKFLAQSGIASRRGADQIIADGRVKVNGKVVSELGAKVNIYNDTIMVDDIVCKQNKKCVVIMFNKPKGCVTTTSDEKGRKTIFDYVDITSPRLFPIGRLDYDSEGLLLLTNDGDLANRISHPSFEITKTYLVKVKGEMPEHKLAQLRKGVMVDGSLTKRSKVKLLEYKDGISRLEVTISEGRNRQVRKMFEAVEREVIFLKRVAIGDLRLGGLSRGGYRYLNEFELEYLKTL